MVELLLLAGGASLACVGIGILVDFHVFRKMEKMLLQPRRVERFVYRHHRVFGGMIFLGALVWLAFLGTLRQPFDMPPEPRAGYLLQVLRYTAGAFALFALVIGGYMLLRPSALKGFEALANRWIEPFPTGDRISKKHLGMGLLLAGAFCLLTLAMLPGA